MRQLRSLAPKASTERRYRYLSTSVVATRLGVTARTIRLWAESCELPAIKIGRQWRIDEAAFDEWHARHQSAVPVGNQFHGNNGNSGNAIESS